MKNTISSLRGFEFFLNKVYCCKALNKYVKERTHSLLLLWAFIFSGCASLGAGGQVQSGRLALANGQADVALAHFQRAAEIDSNYEFAPLREGVWTHMGRAYYSMGKLPEARQALDRAIARYENDFLARLYLGLTLVHAQANRKTEKPFSLQEIIFALKEGVLPKRVAALAEQRGVGFEPTRDGERELKKAGADDLLIRQLRRIRIQYLRKKGPEDPSIEQGLKELERAMGDVHQWLDSISQNPSDGRLWDPEKKIRAQIQTSLGMIADGNIDWQKLITAGEWVGKEMEDEIDRGQAR